MVIQAVLLSFNMFTGHGARERERERESTVTLSRLGENVLNNINSIKNY